MMMIQYLLFTLDGSQASSRCVNNIKSLTAVATGGHHEAVTNSFHRYVENLYNNLTSTCNVEDFVSTVNSDMNIS